MSNYFKKFVALLVILFAFFSLATSITHAQTPTETGKEICDNGIDDDNDTLLDGVDTDCYTLLAPLPGLTTVNTTTGLPSYLNTIFRLLIGIAGVFAVVRIVLFGIQYMTSESAGDRSSIRGKIWTTLGGIILLAGSVILLNTINPKLTDVGLNLQTVSHTLELEETAADPYIAPHTTTGACPYTMTTVHTQEGVNYTSSDPGVQTNLNALKLAITALTDKVSLAGGTVTVTSAHRSLAYQQHFYEIKTLNAQLKADSNPNCASLRQTIQTEITQHGLGGCNTAAGCVVNPPYTPDKCGGAPNQSAAPHVRGTGADITIGGITAARADEIAAANNIKLHWQNLPNDTAHWNLVSPPFTGCASS